MRPVSLDALQRRRLENFRANRRGFWSFRLLVTLFLLALLAEFIANDQPLLLVYRGEIYLPVFWTYPETTFGGEFETAADYRDEVVACLVRTGGTERCINDPFGVPVPDQGAGWMVWPPIPYAYDTIKYDLQRAPSSPTVENVLGTDDQARDVAARVIYGFRISMLFGLSVTAISSVFGVIAGAVQGYFGGRVDLFFQRFEEIWASTPQLYLIMIVSAVLVPSFLTLTVLLGLFGWTALTGVVRAEFLRARNFEYVLAARALGVSNWVIMFRHLLPNAMVATLTMMPFLLTGSISLLAGLDFLGYGLPAAYPSLGELALQGKRNLQAPWLGLTAFFTFAIMLSLLVFIFEAVRDAFDPRKTIE